MDCKNSLRARLRRAGPRARDAAWPLALLFGVACGDVHSEDSLRLVDPPRAAPGSAEDQREVSSVPLEQQPRSLPHQVTVYDEDELDLKDPTALQVNVPAGKEAWVLQGASALVAQTGAKPTHLSAAVQAQRLFADMAKVKATAIVKAVEVSAPIELYGPGPQRDVTFSVQQVIRGRAVPDTWTVRFEEGVNCAQAMPELGSTWLVFLHVSGKAVMLVPGFARLPVSDGKIGGFEGLTVKVSDLAAAVAIADREVAR